MLDIPIGEALPDVVIEVEEGDYVIAAVCFLVTANPNSNEQTFQMAATQDIPGVMARGLAELGRDVVIADQARNR